MSRRVLGGLPMMSLLQCEHMRCTPLGEETRVPFPQTRQVSPCAGAASSAFMLSLLDSLGAVQNRRSAP